MAADPATSASRLVFPHPMVRLAVGVALGRWEQRRSWRRRGVMSGVHSGGRWSHSLPTECVVPLERENN
ncbi:unnamed protein product [Urochloa humidicola]